MNPTSQLQIDLAAIAHNMGAVRRIVGPRVGVCAILKADAYGLGAAGVTRQLIESGADMLAVYTPQQAMALAEIPASVPVLVLMPVRDLDLPEPLYRLLLNGRLHLTVHDLDQLHRLAAESCKRKSAVPVHVEVDTGMSRGGCGLSEAREVIERIAGSQWLQLAGVMTHFATADCDPEFARAQLQTFDSWLEHCGSLIPEPCLVHAANTCATLRGSAFHKSIVRVGIAWAGYGPELLHGSSDFGDAAQLWPSVTWSSQIVQVKRVSRGTPVGYGSRWHADRESVIGLVPVGYADGYPPALGATDARPNAGVVAIPTGSEAAGRPIQAPVVGSVNMDQLTIDLTDVHTSTVRDLIGIGTAVELISADPAAPNHLPTLAALAGIIPYDLLCGLHPRIPRSYQVTAGSLGAGARRVVSVG